MPEFRTVISIFATSISHHPNDIVDYYISGGSMINTKFQSSRHLFVTQEFLINELLGGNADGVSQFANFNFVA